MSLIASALLCLIRDLYVPNVVGLIPRTWHRIAVDLLTEFIITVFSMLDNLHIYIVSM